MATLPAEFADLEPFSDWCLEFGARALRQTPRQQHGRDAGVLRRRVPRLEAAMEHLDQYPLDALPDDASHLLWLCYSLVNVSFPIEVWRQPRVPDSGAASFDQVVEPAV